MNEMQNNQGQPQNYGGIPQSVGAPQYTAAPRLDIPDLPNAQPIKKRTYTLCEGITALLCLLLGFLFVHCCMHNVGGIYGGAFWALFGVLGAVFVRVRKLTVTAGQITLFAVAELFCFVPLFSDNDTINTLAAFFVFALYCYLGITFSGARLLGDRFAADLLGSVFARPFASYGECPVAVAGLFGRAKGARSLLYVFVGLLIALPLTIVVAALLISSDALFENFVDGIFNRLPDFSFDIVGDMIWGIPVALFLCGMLFSAQKKLGARSEEAPSCRFLPIPVVITAVTPICLFYLTYLIIQLRYVFAALGGSLPEGVSYSDFARRGFFELCTVAAINLVVIMLMQALCVRRENDKRPAVLVTYTVMISAFTLLLITAAVSKMFIYIGEYGMTPLRVYTTWFMVLLAVFFVIITLWQFVKLPLWKTVFAAFTVMFGLLCFSNTDGIIANYNVEAYFSGELSEIDTKMLYRELDYAAVPALVRAASYDGAVYRLEMLAQDIQNEDFVAYFSIPRASAAALLEDYKTSESAKKG